MNLKSDEKVFSKHPVDMMPTLHRHLADSPSVNRDVVVSDTPSVRTTGVLASVVLAVLSISACAALAEQDSAMPTTSAAPTQTFESVEWPIVVDAEELEPISSVTDEVSSDDRILALAVGSGDVVELLGAGGQLVGQDETSSVSSDVPVVTTAHQIDVEQALSLQPTVVFVDELTGPPEAVDGLRASGAEVVEVPAVWTLTDVPPRVRVIADALDVEASIANELSDRLAPNASTVASSRARVAFLYLRGPSAVYLLGGANTGADALIDAAGATDVGAELGYDGFVPLTAEAIVQADPDVLLVMTDGLESVGGIDGLVELPGIAQTEAGRERRVVEVDDRTLLSFGARTPALVQVLSEAFAAAA